MQQTEAGGMRIPVPANRPVQQPINGAAADNAQWRPEAKAARSAAAKADKTTADGPRGAASKAVWKEAGATAAAGKYGSLPRDAEISRISFFDASGRSHKADVKPTGQRHLGRESIYAEIGLNGQPTGRTFTRDGETDEFILLHAERNKPARAGPAAARSGDKTPAPADRNPQATSAGARPRAAHAAADGGRESERFLQGLMAEVKRNPALLGARGFTSRAVADRQGVKFSQLPDAAKFRVMAELMKGASTEIPRKTSHKIAEQLTARDPQLGRFLNSTYTVKGKEFQYRSKLTDEKTPTDKLSVLERVCKSRMNKVLSFAECTGAAMYAAGYIARPINEALRAGDKSHPAQDLAKVVRGAAHKLHHSRAAAANQLRFSDMSPYNGAYRYIQPPAAANGQPQNSREFVLEKIGKPGDIITDPSIVSTSMSFTAASHRLITGVAGGTPKVCVLYNQPQTIIPLVDKMEPESSYENRTGIEPNGLGHCTAYAEAIIAPGSHFRVADVSYDARQKFTTVILEQIPASVPEAEDDRALVSRLVDYDLG
ncbi:hypothetical protein K3725_21345 (plasmid) [Leisingera sp. S132]|uniref:hypothetical protein n=1 Tax=Leisingera sp. S132 TaxID=2867016 RepID=UPI0021A60276|nr:hypothetical protein [Leisingera sp. S132]UWQ81775.1 hypothetical protein K3725_21345 [Leisingera sp. S132]